MGLFSSKTKINVSTAALHLMEAAENPAAEAVVTATVAGRDFTEEILSSVMSGYGIKMGPAFRYAKSDYYYGLPSGSRKGITPVSDETLAPIIAQDIVYADGVSVIASVATDMNPIIALFPWLEEERGYDLNTNRITKYPASLASTISSLKSQGKKVLVFLSDADLSEDELSLKFKYSLVNRSTYVEETTYSETILIPTDPEPDYDSPCIYAAYMKLDAQGELIEDEVYHWLYYLADETYSILSGTSTEYVSDEFLPVIPLRYDNVDLCASAYQEGSRYLTSKKLLDLLDMDIDDLAAKVNANPDIDDIDHAYVMFGVDLQTDNNASLWYLGKFFERLSDRALYKKVDYLASLIDYSTGSKSRRNVYRAGSGDVDFLEKGLNLEISYDYITVDLEAGDIGPIGTATKSLSTGSTSSSTYLWNSFLQRSSPSRLTLRLQVSPGSIKKVCVYGLTTRNTIYRGKSVLTSISDVKNDSDNHNMIIPLEYNMAHSMPLMLRNDLYKDCALMVINTYVKTKQKWYQSGWFKVILIAVAIVITAFTGQAWVMALVEAGYTMAVAIAITVVSMAAISVTLKTVTSWIIDKWGAELGVLGAIVLTAVSMVFGEGLGSIELIAEFTLSTAQVMTQVAMALVSTVNEFLVGVGQEIVDEYQAFREMMEDRWEELETAEDLLGNKYDISPLEYTSPSRLKMMPSESPEAFIQRTIELPGNTYYTVHNQISDFYNMRKSLNKNIPSELYNQNIRG